MGRRRWQTPPGLGAAARRPLSEPGAAGRVAPFAGAAIISLVLLLWPPSSTDRFSLAAAVLMAIVIAAALLVPWIRLPPWCQATVPLTFLVVVALLRHAGGGASSGYAPLVMLPILWLAIYGTRAQFRVGVSFTAATFLVPLVLVGPPRYPAGGWREALTWATVGLLAGSATQTLVSQSRHRAADVAALGAVTRALTAGSDPRPELCAAAQLVTGAAFVVLFEQDADGTLVSTAGTDGFDLGPTRIDPQTDNSAVAVVWRTATRMYVADPAAGPRASTEPGWRTGAGAMLFEPVTRDGRGTGVLVIGLYESRQRVPESALYLVELLAAEVGAAIDRADLVELLAAQSRRDPLTSAANRRSWDEELDHELARAHRTGKPFAVALLDMDNFKAYNDAFGHLAGDEILLNLVAAIRVELRAGDIVARWGGEEFALALHDCDLDEAQTIAARLLRVVPGGQTASIGLTQSRTEDTREALMERADRALYTARDGGRNQVKTYQAPAPVAAVRGGDA